MIKDIRYYNRKYDKIVDLSVTAGRHACQRSSAVHLDITLHGRSSNNKLTVNKLTVDFDLTDKHDKAALKELISSLQEALGLYEESNEK